MKRWDHDFSILPPSLLDFPHGGLTGPSLLVPAPLSPSSPTIVGTLIMEGNLSVIASGSAIVSSPNSPVPSMAHNGIVQSNFEPEDPEAEAASMTDKHPRFQTDLKAQTVAEPQETSRQDETRPSPLGHSEPLQNSTTVTTYDTQEQGHVATPSEPVATAHYNLFENPPNIARIRQIMFELKDPIEISLGEFEMYWPFIDNVWVKQRSNSTKDGLSTSDYYMCRLRRATCKPNQTRPLPEGKRPRKKVVREGGTCNVQMKVVRFEGAYSTVTISRTPGSNRTHSHDLDYIDKVKRNSGLMEFARKEAEKGYLPSSIFAKFREEPETLLAAGGKFLSVTDVRNASSRWRSVNPDVVLKPHEGYQYHQGHGVVRIQDGPVQATDDSNTVPAKPPTPITSVLPADVLPFPRFSLDFLDPYLPNFDEKRKFPHVTLTYASSLDSKISLMPGVQTILSGQDSKLMTHYLRSRHDAILVGVGTVMADNPGLNCRLEGAGGFGGLGRMWQPRPIIVDPTGRWPAHPESKLLNTALQGKGKAPWIVVSPGADVHPPRLRHRHEQVPPRHLT